MVTGDAQPKPICSLVSSLPGGHYESSKLTDGDAVDGRINAAYILLLFWSDTMIAAASQACTKEK